MKIILSAIDDELAAAWRHWCGELEQVEIHRGDILDSGANCVVSPANSFGFMDGGIDAVYVKRFGSGVECDFLDHVRTHGELLVGQTTLLQTGDRQIPWLIAAPTMRVPMRLPADTVNPYLAARAALHGAFNLYRGGVVHAVAFPGLGTGVGGVSPALCARQMRAAIEFVRGDRKMPESWWEASEAHQRLYSNTVRDLQEQ